MAPVISKYGKFKAMERKRGNPRDVVLGFVCVYECVCV